MVVCFFCDVLSRKLSLPIVAENAFAFAMHSEFPCCEHHLLIVSKRCVCCLEKLSFEELASFYALTVEVIDWAKKQFGFTDYNVGINCGMLAGQSIFHLHQHIFPRKKGDVVNPKGGVRNIFPTGDYTACILQNAKRKKYVKEN